VFGVAALASGLITLAWHDYNDGHLLRYIVYAAAAGLIFGGAAIQFRRSAKAGAAVLGAAYLVFVLLCVPGIVAAPQIYNSWGNFFEQSVFWRERRSFIRACHQHGRRKRLIGSGAFFWASVPRPLPSNRRFILTQPPNLFRSGFRPLRCFGR